MSKIKQFVLGVGGVLLSARNVFAVSVDNSPLQTGNDMIRSGVQSAIVDLLPYVNVMFCIIVVLLLMILVVLVRNEVLISRINQGVKK